MARDTNFEYTRGVMTKREGQVGQKATAKAEDKRGNMTAKVDGVLKAKRHGLAGSGTDGVREGTMRRDRTGIFQ